MAQGYYFYDNGHFEPSVVFDLSGNLGIMNQVSDIGGSKTSKSKIGAYNFRNSHFTGGITLSATYRDVIAIRLDLGIGRIEAHDSLLKGATHFSSIGRYERNLNYRSSIFDGMVGIEFHPIYLKNYQDLGLYTPRLSPYITAGIGFVNFKPQGFIDEKWVDLQPLRLEGQGFEEYPDRQQYRTTAITYPLGIGLKYDFSSTFIFRLEFIHKFTSTDYLDDVSMGNWVDPSLFQKYLQPAQAVLASRMYNRSILVNPPRNTRPRGDDSRNDLFWQIQFRAGIALNRNRR
jgi:opacity protein-like surface antigen